MNRSVYLYTSREGIPLLPPSSHKRLSMLVEILISDKPVTPLPSRLNSFLRNARSATAFSMETEMAIELSEKQHSKDVKSYYRTSYNYNKMLLL